MAFHITVCNDDGNVITDTDTEAIALVYDSEDGVHAESMLNCGGMTALHILLSLDKLKEHICDTDPILAIIYNHRDEIIAKTIEIDVGAIKRSMMNEEDDEE